jgi:tetratricopeptide (TPR) repeat protein
MPCKVIGFVVLCLLFNPATSLPQQATRPDPEFTALQGRLQDLQRQFEAEKLNNEKRLQQDLDAINRRFDDTQQNTQRIFWLLTSFGALGAIFGFTSWFGGRQDYKRERDFYEKRVSGIDAQQTILSKQQIDLGAAVLHRSDEMLDSIGKLGQVIELVRKSFDLQIKREGEVESMTAIIDDLKSNFKDAYNTIHGTILPLKNVTRMGWASLDVSQDRLIAGARAEFRTIPDFLLKEREREDAYEFARVCQLLGASALYANDIEFAERLLKRSAKVYESIEFRRDYCDSMAAVYFFLGLISKSWLDANRPLSDGLGEAKKHLQKAADLLVDKKAEFLVPVTLAEIRTYTEAERTQALRQLRGLAGDLRTMTGRDENQKRLLIRSLLLLGNIEESGNRSACYQEALDLDPDNPYAALSLALITSDKVTRKKLFARGLELLKKAKSTEKAEVTIRATAVAWAAVASHELAEGRDESIYLKQLERLSQAVISTGARIPLAFCPLTKLPTTFESLRQNVLAHIAKPIAAVAAM